MADWHIEYLVSAVLILIYWAICAWRKPTRKEAVVIFYLYVLFLAIGWCALRWLVVALY